MHISTEIDRISIVMLGVSNSWFGAGIATVVLLGLTHLCVPGDDATSCRLCLSSLLLLCVVCLYDMSALDG